METTGGIQASLGGRYAKALFELARDSSAIDTVRDSLGTLRRALAESDDFRALTTSPQISRADAGRTVAALAPTLGLDPLTVKFLGVLAANGRLFQLGAIIRAFEAIVAAYRGEMTAQVTSAHALDDDQVDAIRQKLRTRFGRDVGIDLTVDPAILGGLVVRAGSTQIDGSIRTKLNTLATAMKG